MSQKRKDRFSENISHQLSGLLNREVEFESGVLVTVSRIEMLPDFSYARIFVSVLPAGEAKNALKILKKNTSRLKYKLTGRLATGRTPKFSFVLDENPEKHFEVEALLDQVLKDDADTEI